MHCTDDATAGRIDFHATASHTHTQHTFVIESLVNYVIRSHSKATIDRRCQSQKLEKCKTKFMINVIEVHCMNWCARVQNCASICKRSLQTCTGFVSVFSIFALNVTGFFSRCCLGSSWKYQLVSHSCIIFNIKVGHKTT